jgi:photosystem II stability/assembly factor-like uncharacterized protein
MPMSRSAVHRVGMMTAAIQHIRCSTCSADSATLALLLQRRKRKFFRLKMPSRDGDAQPHIVWRLSWECKQGKIPPIYRVKLGRLEGGHDMVRDYSICLGTAGWGVWHSPDAGKSWLRHRAPFPLNSRIQALVAHPTETHTVFAGGDTGLFVSQNGGAKWERIGSEDALPTIWSLTVDPVEPNILFAGTRPAGVYRSRDGGQHWEKLAIDMARECSIGTPFVTSVLVDPDDHHLVWAGVEIDGVFRSLDGGETWTHVEGGLYDPDIHAMALVTTKPTCVFASTAGELFASVDRGEKWQALGVKAKWPLPYVRGIAVKADDSGVLYAGCGETTTGEKGHVLRSADAGERWEVLKLPTPPNSTIWGLATHPADANRILAFSLFGEVYISDDAGDSWSKIAREFGEIRTAAWLPN